MINIYTPMGEIEKVNVEVFAIENHIHYTGETLREYVNDFLLRNSFVYKIVGNDVLIDWSKFTGDINDCN